MMHSAAKFISGHSDLLGGVLVVAGERRCRLRIKMMVLHVEKQQLLALKRLVDIEQ